MKNISEKWQLPIEEKGLVITNNSTGYMLEEPDPFIKKFINYTTLLKNKEPNATVVDIGAAFGVATIELLKNGLHVIANDMDVTHLQTLKAKTPKILHKNLTIQQAEFPYKTTYKQNSIHAFLISRVLHFLPGEAIDYALDLIYQSLISGGKLFISTASPYIKFLQPLINLYEKNEEINMKWPGDFENIAHLVPKKNIDQIPKKFHAITPNVIANALKRHGFSVEIAEYGLHYETHTISALDGRERTLAIGVKKYCKKTLGPC